MGSLNEFMKLRKDNKKVKYVVKKNTVSEENEKSNIIEEIYKASTDNGIVNLEKKLCYQYEEDDEKCQVEEQEITPKEIENKEEVVSEEAKVDEVKKEKKKFTENIVIKKIISVYKSVFSHPEDIEKSFFDWLDSGKKLAFLSALIVGIITHITFLTEMIMSPDGLWNSICYFEADNWEASLGRWGLLFANKIVNNLAIPNLTGVVAIVLISISAMFIVDILKLKNKITIFIVSSAMVVSPALSGTLLYMYTSVAYCLAMILSVLTVKLIFKEKYKIFNLIFAIAIFTFSLGIYQSYIGVTVGLTVIRLIRDLYDKNVKIKWFFIHGIMMCVIVIVGGMLYSHITENVLEKMQLTASSYKGMENINIQNTLDSLDKSIPKIYEEFKAFYFEDSIVVNSNYSRQEFYKLMFLVAIILELILIITSGVWKNPFRIIFIILLNVILPVALNVILLLTTETSIYLLTCSQLLLVIPLVAMICEMSGKKFTYIFKWGAIISMFLVVFSYYLADNCSYMALKLTYNQAYSTSIRIMDRMEETEGYSPDKPVMIAGVVYHNGPQFFRNSNIYLYTLGTIFDLSAFHATYSGMEGTWTQFLGNFLGMKIHYCNETSYNDVINSEEFKEMGIFPAPNSCKEIYGIMVVKLSDTPPMP